MRFRDQARMFEYTTDNEQGSENRVLQALKQYPSQHILVPIESPPIEKVNTAFVSNFVLHVSNHKVEFMKYKNGDLVQLDGVSQAATDEKKTWLNFINGINKLRDLDKPVEAGVDRPNPLNFKRMGSGTFNNVWGPTSRQAAADHIPEQLMPYLDHSSQNGIVRFTRDDADVPCDDASRRESEACREMIGEAVSMLEAARDGFGLNIHALFFQAEEVDAADGQPSFVRYRMVCVMQRATATVGDRWRKRTKTPVPGSIPGTLRGVMSVWNYEREYFEKLRSSLLKMSMRRIIHFDLSSNNVMDQGLPGADVDARWLAPQRYEYEKNMNAKGAGFGVLMIDMAEDTYRRLHVRESDSLTPWFEHVHGQDKLNLSDVRVGEGWRPLFLYNYLVVSCWLRLNTDEAVFGRYWHHQQRPTDHTAKDGVSMARVLDQLNAETRCPEGQRTGGTGVGRVPGVRDAEYEAAREFVNACTWEKDLVHSNANVERPSGNDARTFAKLAREMQSYYLYSSHFIQAHALFYNPMLEFCKGAHSRLAMGMSPDTITLASLPEDVKRAFTWYETVYVPKILPTAFFFHRRCKTSTQIQGGPAPKLVDVMLEYVNTPMDKLDQQMRVREGVLPKTRIQILHDVKKAANGERSLPEAHKLLSFPC